MTARQLPIPVMVPQLPNWDVVERYIRQIDRNHWYSNFGPLVCELEQRLALHFGGTTGTVLTLANATLGIALALQEAAVKGSPGCLMPSWTFVATPHAARMAGLMPIFADVDPAGGTLTPEIAEAALARFPQIGAVIVVAPFGAPLPIEDWRAFRKRTGIPVVVDAAAGFDTAVLCDLPTVVSLHATKPLGCGEGGIVMSTDHELIARLLSRSNFGFVSTREAMLAGTNAKMSEYHAAVALAALDTWAETRRSLCGVASLYRDALQARNWAILPDGWGERWISTTLNLRLGPTVERGAFDSFMNQNGIDIRRWWADGCHLHPAFADCPSMSLPETDRIARHSIGVPFSLGLGVGDIRHVVTTIEAALERI